MATKPQWTVEHYQIGSARDGQGEAAIVLVVDKNPNSVHRQSLTVAGKTTTIPAGAKGTVYKAFLIDGAFSVFGVNNMISTMEEIKADYNIQTSCLKFDAVVITHWDTDHFSGFSKAAICLLTHGLTGYQTSDGLIACFKFDAAKKPLTRLYCQHWQKAGGKGKLTSPGFTARDDEKDTFTVGYDDGTNQNDAIMEAWAATSLTIGTNLVTGNRLPTDAASTFDKIANLDTLLKKNPPWLATSPDTIDCPGLYIVGARGRHLGGGNIVTNMMVNNSGPHILVVDEGPKKSEAKFGTYVTNPRSIQMLLIWQEASDKTFKTRVSLYTGGDSEWETEKLTADWLKASSVDKVSVVKVGHHGSRRGTSATLLQQLRPDKILISAGNGDGHPVHQLLWWLDAWFGSIKGASAVVGHRIYATCYPYWLGKTVLKNSQVLYLLTAEFQERFYDATQDSNPSQRYKMKLTPQLIALYTTYRAQLKRLYTEAGYNTGTQPKDPVVTLCAKVDKLFADETTLNDEWVKAYDDAKEKEQELEKTIANTDATAQEIEDAKEASHKADEANNAAQEKYEAHSEFLSRKAWTPLAKHLEGFWARWANTKHVHFPASHSATGDDSLITYQDILQNSDVEEVLYVKATYVHDPANDASFTTKVSGTKFKAVYNGDRKRKAITDFIAMSVSHPITNDGSVSGEAVPTNIDSPDVSALRMTANASTLMTSTQLQTLQRRITELTPTFDVPLNEDLAYRLTRMQTSEYGERDVYNARVRARPVSSLAPQTLPTLLVSDIDPNAVIVTPRAAGAIHSLVPSTSNVAPNGAAIPDVYTKLDDFLASLGPEPSLSLSNSFVSADFAQQWTSAVRAPCTSDLSTWIEGDSPSVELHMSGPSPSRKHFLSHFETHLLLSKLNSKLIYTSSINTIDKHTANDLATTLVLYDEQGFYRIGCGIAMALAAETSQFGKFKVTELYSEIVGLPVPSFLKSDLELTVDSHGRNMIWYTCEDAQSTTIAHLTASHGDKAEILAFPIPGISFSETSFLVRKHVFRSNQAFVDATGLPTHGATLDHRAEVCISSTAKLFLDKASDPLKSKFLISISMDETTLGLVIRPSADSMVLSDILSWIERRTGISDFFKGTDGRGDQPCHAWLDDLVGNNTDLYSLRELALELVRYEDGWHFFSVVITFQVNLTWGVKDSKNKIPIMLSFSCRNPPGYSNRLYKFTGRLWPRYTDQIMRHRSLNPEMDLLPPLLPTGDAKLRQNYISLKHLIDGDTRGDSPTSDSLPNGIPTAITDIDFVLSNKEITLTGELQCDPDMKKQDVPHIYLSRIVAHIGYTWATKAVDLAFSVTALLEDRDNLTGSQVEGTLAYNSRQKAWSLKADAEFLDFGSLYSLFPTSDQDAVINTLQNVALAEMMLSYEYNGSGLGSTFIAQGQLLIDDIALEMKFEHHSSAPDASKPWTLTAKLDVTSINSSFESGEENSRNLGSVIAAISPDLENDLPEYLSKISLKLDTNDKIELEVRKMSLDQNTTAIVALLSVSIGHFNFSFVQFSEAKPASNTTKRLLRVMLDGLPNLNDVPFLSNIDIPFEGLDFIWADKDITRQEMDACINEAYLYLNNTPVLYKDPRNSVRDRSKVDLASSSARGTDIVFNKGSHFIVTGEQDRKQIAVLDYNFSTPAKKPSDKRATAPIALDNQPVAEDKIEEAGTTAALTNQQGPLSFSGLGFKYDQLSQSVSISFNAVIKLGPVECILTGFAVTFPIDLLQHFDHSKVHMSLQGIGLEMNRPPIVLAGEIIHKDNEYSGGLAAEIEPYSFLAAAYYGNFEAFKSMFVFAKLEGPFLELEFASLSGLTAGFGYHSDVTIPTAQNVTTFPFIADTFQGGKPLEVLHSLTNGSWFKASNGPIWFAAGLSASFFHMLTAKAVIMVDIQSHDVILGVFAAVDVQIPPAPEGDSTDNATKIAGSFAEVELGIVALLDFAKGTFSVEGQLTPKSFIFSRSCHLTGGFALCYWFQGSGHIGDWVFTLGGYHPSFERPVWYPNPGRLAISWNYDDELSIYGDAYFAITPKAVMGGGKLDMVYKSGRLYASLHAYADFLINYSPFTFVADAGIEVKASYTMGWGYLSKTSHLDMSANLHLHGPPLAGTAHINWTIFAFDVEFGKAEKKRDPLTWTDFVKTLKQGDDKKSLLQLKYSGGLQGDDNKAADEDFHTTEAQVRTVDATSLDMVLSCLFPVTSIEVEGTAGTTKPNHNQVYIKPMQITEAVSSSLTLSLKMKGSNDQVPVRFSASSREAPMILWDKYDRNTDPSLGAKSSAQFNTANSTKSLCLSVDIRPPSSSEPPDSFRVNKNTCLQDCTQRQPIETKREYAAKPQKSVSLISPQLDQATSTRAAAFNGTREGIQPLQRVFSAWHSPKHRFKDVMKNWCSMTCPAPDMLRPGDKKSVAPVCEYQKRLEKLVDEDAGRPPLLERLMARSARATPLLVM